MTPEDEALLEKLARPAWADNGVPDAERAAARELAAKIVEVALGAALPPGRLSVSPLGPAWSTDLDVYLEECVASHELRALGWVSLRGLAGRVRDGGRWAVVEEGRVVAGVDVHVGVPPDEVDAVLTRCLRIGRVRLREVLELRVLQRSGHDLPVSHPALTIAARAEQALGGSDLAAWREGPAQLPPIELDRGPAAGMRARVGRFVRRPAVIAVSGVDGAGKSTLADALVRELGSAGLHVTRVWARPGMQMRSVKSLAKLVKRVLGRGSSAAVRTVARGEQGDDLPVSRRGIVGWTWALLVTLSYVARVRAAALSATGTLVFDRHLLDALVTLDFVYGTLDLRIHRALIRKMIPKATLTLYLTISADAAVARKQSVVFGEYAVRRQLEHYERRRAEVRPLVELDAEEPPDALIGDALRAIDALDGDRDGVGAPNA